MTDGPDSGVRRECEFGHGYDPEWLANELLRESLLFGTEAECCNAHPGACPGGE